MYTFTLSFMGTKAFTCKSKRLYVCHRLFPKNIILNFTFCNWILGTVCSRGNNNFLAFSDGF